MHSAGENEAAEIWEGWTRLLDACAELAPFDEHAVLAGVRGRLRRRRLRRLAVSSLCAGVLLAMAAGVWFAGRRPGAVAEHADGSRGGYLAWDDELQEDFELAWQEIEDTERAWRETGDALAGLGAQMIDLEAEFNDNSL